MVELREGFKLKLEAAKRSLIWHRVGRKYLDGDEIFISKVPRSIHLS